MKPMCVAVRVGCVFVGLLVGIGANADWQFSHHVNPAGDETCSAVLSQGHMIDGNMMAHLPRGTLEMFRDADTANIRMQNDEMASKPVLAFHWLYPRDTRADVGYQNHSEEYTYHVWDPRSQQRVPMIGTALTRRWNITYKAVDAAGNVYSSGEHDAWTPGNGYVERVGDVMPAGDALDFVDIATRGNAQYIPGPDAALLNSSFWWDIPDDVMDLFKGSDEFTLTVSFPGHSGMGSAAAANTGSRHPGTVVWKVKGAGAAYEFVNTADLCP